MVVSNPEPSSSHAPPMSQNNLEEENESITTVSYPDGPTLSFLWSREEPLIGQSLYLGGDEGSDGNIYCIPGHAPRVLFIDTKTDQVYPIGPDLKGKFKWLRSVPSEDVIYGLPCHADSVLRIHVPTRSITTLSIPYEDFYADNGEEAKEQREMTWKYHGGAMSPIDGCIYSIPQSARHVLRIDPRTDSCRLVGPPLPGRYKWYGGVVGKDGAIYGIPHNSPSVLRIDPSMDPIATLHGDYGTGGHKWHGGVVAPDGSIVCVPANADTVLCVSPGPQPALSEVGGPDTVRTGRHRSDSKYKYLGAMTGTDGRVYFFPSGAERVLQVDMVTNQATMVGPNLFDTQMERMLQNKWQNGIYSSEEQCVYAIPLSAETVLRIDTSQPQPEVSTWKLPRPYSGLAKWEGGLLASNGAMYCMPNNHKAVLRITSKPRTLDTSAIKEKKQNDFVKQGNDVTEGMGGATCDNSSLPEESKREKEDKDTEHKDNIEFAYTTGIPTLRSSAHRVKAPRSRRKHNPKPKHRNGDETLTTLLPPEVCKEHKLTFDVSSYDFHQSVSNLLESCDEKMVGYFRTLDSNATSTRLEDFFVPEESLSRSSYGGHCEAAQKYLSNAVASDQVFLEVFDRFVIEVVLPHLKSRLVASGALEADENIAIAFYYQRPPTLRLQPGPARSIVKAHHDAEYGHQNGELNFWIPLTGRATGVDLWCESGANLGDYHPTPADYGEVVSFHGSSCRHYVNANHTRYTRVSLDFRVGVEGFFDPGWQMHGTSDDHDRREVRM